MLLPLSVGRRPSRRTARTINVDPAVEKAGWTVLLAGEPVLTEPLHTSSYRLDMPIEKLRLDPTLEVHAGTPVQGEWAFSIRHLP